MDAEFYRYMTQAEIAKIFATNAVTIHRWVGEGLPFENVGRKKTYDPAKVHDWLMEKELAKRAVKVKKSGSKSLDDDLMDPDQFDDNLDKFRYYKAEQAKLALEKEKGGLISKEDHDDFVRQAGDFVRSGFQTLPKKLAVRLAKLRDSGDIEKLLEEEIVETLIRLSKLELNE